MLLVPSLNLLRLSFVRSLLRKGDVYPHSRRLMHKTFTAWSLNGFSTAFTASVCVRLHFIILQAHHSFFSKAHPIHIIFWSIFFGPIIIFMPCLLRVVLEVIILALYNLNFITRSLLLPGTLFLLYYMPSSCLPYFS
jgi:hypothetical protein